MTVDNPILRSTRSLLGRLDDETLEAAEDAVRIHAQAAIAELLSLEDELNLLKAAKWIATNPSDPVRSDKLSAPERQALRHILDRYRMPDAVQDHVLAFDVSEVRREHVIALVPRGSARARFLLAGAISLAAVDNLSTVEHEHARSLGADLGLNPALVAVFIAHAEAEAFAYARDDPEMLRRLRALRFALLRMP